MPDGINNKLTVHSYGVSGPQVIVLHGGPGAAGSAAPLARGLADSFGVLEPWQRTGAGEPVTVAQHIADLHELIKSRCGGEKPALVGESWGAMLALAYAAAHPAGTKSLVLIGCGTFDQASRRQMEATIEARMNDQLRRQIKSGEFTWALSRLKSSYTHHSGFIIRDFLFVFWNNPQYGNLPACGQQDGQSLAAKRYPKFVYPPSRHPLTIVVPGSE